MAKKSFEQMVVDHSLRVEDWAVLLAVPQFSNQNLKILNYFHSNDNRPTTGVELRRRGIIKSLHAIQTFNAFLKECGLGYRLTRTRNAIGEESGWQIPWCIYPIIEQKPGENKTIPNELG